MNKKKIIFLATPGFALEAIRAVESCGDYEVIAVITQPDKPAGRGLKLTPSPVKTYAESRSIPVFQPASLKPLTCIINESNHTTSLQCSNDDLTDLCNFLNKNNDALFVVVAYGKIIPDSLLQFSRYPMLNIHPSLLPRWRGAAPIQHALFAGDQETGVAIMQLDSGLDTGPVFKIEKTPILPHDNLETLHDRLATLGAKLLLDVIPEVVSKNITPSPQTNDGVTYAEKWDKEDCLINWNDPTNTTLRRIRTCSPHPGAKTTYNGKDIKVFEAHLVQDTSYSLAMPGEIVEVNKAELIVAATNSGYISIDIAQFPGKSRLPIKDILRGHHFKVGEKFI